MMKELTDSQINIIITHADRLNEERLQGYTHHLHRSEGERDKEREIEGGRGRERQKEVENHAC